MKRTSTLLMLAAGLVCSGPLSAQEYPTELPAPKTSARIAPAPAPATGAPVILDDLPGHPEAGIACDDCSEAKKRKRYCVPEAEVKKKTHASYSLKVDEICRYRCSRCGMARGLFGRKKCTDCEDDCNRCGKVRCRRRLVKKFVSEECPDTKCVPPRKCDEQSALVSPAPAATPAPVIPQAPARH